jgi:hypothetical protein
LVGRNLGDHLLPASRCGSVWLGCLVVSVDPVLAALASPNLALPGAAPAGLLAEPKARQLPHPASSGGSRPNARRAAIASVIAQVKNMVQLGEQVI